MYSVSQVVRLRIGGRGWGGAWDERFERRDG